MLNITIPDIPKEILMKVVSGRYFLTIIGGFVFAYAVWAKIMPSEATAAILSSIFVSYFSRTDRQNGGGVK
jgi:hypothetical protein